MRSHWLARSLAFSVLASGLAFAQANTQTQPAPSNTGQAIGAPSATPPAAPSPTTTKPVTPEAKPATNETKPSGGSNAGASSGSNVPMEAPGANAKPVP